MAGKFVASGDSLCRADDLEAAWRDRLEDAHALLQAGRHAAAIAFGIYALEIRLKARVCRCLDLDRLPKEFEIHDLAGLLSVSGLSKRMKSNQAVNRNWTDVRLMSNSLNDLRYSPSAGFSASQAEKFFHQLDNSNDGIMTWLSTQS